MPDRVRSAAMEAVATPEPRAWRRGKDCVIVRVRLTPKSARTLIDGIGETADGPAVLARVNAVPEDGAANAALEQLIARWLDVPKTAVSLVQGGKSRVKSLSISGDEDALEALLSAKVAALGEAR